MEQKLSRWEKGISMGELIAVFVVVIGSFLMFWKTTDIRLSALELQMQQKSQTDNGINNKLDKLQEGINDVRITLQNKQDRKQ